MYYKPLPINAYTKPYMKQDKLLLLEILEIVKAELEQSKKISLCTKWIHEAYCNHAEKLGLTMQEYKKELHREIIKLK